MTSQLDGIIKWSKCSYKMRDFVEGFSQALPLLCRTTAGYSGCDEDFLQIGSGEVYWIFDVYRQKRLVLEPKDSKFYLSVPIEYPIKVQILQEGGKKVGHAVPIQEVLNAMTTSQSQVKVIFENDCKVSFQIGADMGGCAKFGVLSVQQSYEEKYLLAYTVCGRSIFSYAHSIPVYLPIEFSVAEGLALREENVWHSWRSGVKQLTRQFKSTAVRTSQEIILFNERPSGGEYEYIKLANFSSFSPNDKIYSSPITKIQNVYDKSNPRPGHFPGANKNHSVLLPRFPPPAPMGSDGKPILSTPVASAESSHRVGTSHPTASNLYRDDPTKRKVLPLPSNPTTFSKDQYESLDPTGHSSSSFGIYTSLSEVPTDINFGILTVEEVADCLALLKLEKHCQDFRARHVDGKMVLCLSEEMLVEDFNFRSFDAKQFLLFAKEKWRPKRTNTET